MCWRTPKDVLKFSRLIMRFHIMDFMAKITVAIPQELYDRMKKHSEVRWSKVIRKALTEYVGRLEIIEGGIVSSEKLAEMLKEADLDVSCVDLDKAVEFYEKGRKLEWKRSSTTRASS